MTRLVPFAALLALSACEVPTAAQRQQLNAMVGKSTVDVIRQFGVPQRSFQASGHNFLAYIDNQSNYSPGGGWGWGWGGGPWGGGWGGGYGGWGGGFGGWGGGWGGGYGGGFASTVYNTSCQTTFELVNDRVLGWTMRGDGC